MGTRELREYMYNHHNFKYITRDKKKQPKVLNVLIDRLRIDQMGLVLKERQVDETVDMSNVIRLFG